MSKQNTFWSEEAHQELLKRCLEIKALEEPIYIIGADATDIEEFSYVLIRRFKKKADILLARTTCDPQHFVEEIKILSRIFNAQVIKQDE